MTTPATPVRSGKDWLPEWDPEATNWDSGRAWKTLSVTTFALTLGFITWFLASAIAPKLNSVGFDLSEAQLYWLIAMPGLAGGSLRLVWTFLPPIMGTRKLVTLTSGLFLIPLLGWALAVQNPNTPFAVLLILGGLAGLGGGAFSGFMPSTSYFFPRSKQGLQHGAHCAGAAQGDTRPEVRADQWRRRIPHDSDVDQVVRGRLGARATAQQRRGLDDDEDGQARAVLGTELPRPGPADHNALARGPACVASWCWLRLGHQPGQGRHSLA